MLWKPYGTKMSVPDWSRGSDVQGGQLIFPYWHCHLVLLLICFPFSLLPHLILLCISHHVEWTVKDLWMLGESSISFLPRVPAGHGKTVTSDLLPASLHRYQAALGARYKLVWIQSQHVPPYCSVTHASKLGTEQCTKVPQSHWANDDGHIGFNLYKHVLKACENSTDISS